MKKIISIALTAIIAATMTFSAMTVSAANGVDIVDTFESYYKKKDLISSTWKTDGTFKGNVSTDTTTSAPNRGDGKSEGNYRSMKAVFDFSTESWGSIRDMTEDNQALVDAVNANQDVFFTFYAKADKPMVFRPQVDIKDCPFYTTVQITTEWKKYSVSLRDLTPAVNDKNGNPTKIYERNAGKTWGNGTEEAYLIGFKIEALLEDNANMTNGTLWLDTFAFEGATIKERDGDGENTMDKAGTVPADFKADAPTTSTPTTSSVTNSTSSSTTGATSSVNGTTSSVDSTTVDSSEQESNVSSDDEDDSSIDKDDSEEDSSEEADEKDEKAEKKGMKTGTKVAIIIAVVVVLAGAGACVYFFVIKKKKEEDKE